MFRIPSVRETSRNRPLAVLDSLRGSDSTYILRGVHGVLAISKQAERTERKYLRYAGLGVQLGVAIALFTLGGVWLDKKYPSVEPLWTIVGFMLGAIGGMTSLVYGVLRKDNAKEPQ